jgi:hypothetical protein
MDSHIGVSWVELHKHCSKNRDIAKRDIPTVKGSCGAIGVSEVDRWHTISDFRGEKSRNNRIRIHDVANSKMSME